MWRYSVPPNTPWSAAAEGKTYFEKSINMIGQFFPGRKKIFLSPFDGKIILKTNQYDIGQFIK